MVETSSPVRFNTRLKVKEDYDFTMAHISAFGGVVRANHLLVKARHRTNAGGACTKVRAKHDTNAISFLRKKWKHAIRSHTRRKLEIGIHVPKLDKKIAAARNSQAIKQPFLVERLELNLMSAFEKNV